jgi:cytochrome c-type biogenesis protein CcmE
VAEAERDSISFPPEGESHTGSHRTRFFILGAVLALAVGYMAYAAFPANALYFLTVSEFMSSEEYRDGRVLRVSGKLVEDSFLREDGSTVSHFQLTDKDAPSDTRLAASYVGVMPDLFFNPHSEIILEGRYGQNNVFEADSILVKCPSKYQALEDEPQYQQQTNTAG